MPKCKICGEAARAGSVIHSDCITRWKEEILSAVCDEYCRFCLETEDPDELNEKHCDNCKVAKLLGV